MINKNFTDDAILRQKAEEHLVSQHSNADLELFEFDNLEIFHELQVYQIELEMKNDELINAILDSNISARKYFELYDFSPIGFFTLSRKVKLLN